MQFHTTCDFASKAWPLLQKCAKIDFGYAVVTDRMRKIGGQTRHQMQMSQHNLLMFAAKAMKACSPRLEEPAKFKATGASKI